MIPQVVVITIHVETGSKETNILLLVPSLAADKLHKHASRSRLTKVIKVGSVQPWAIFGNKALA